MQSTPDLITALEHFPVRWTIEAAAPLTGSVAIAFTPAVGAAAAGPDDSTTWFTASWSDDEVGATVRTFELTVAGSDAADSGAFPGVGDFTVWARYADATSVRVKQAGVLRFR